MFYIPTRRVLCRARPDSTALPSPPGLYAALRPSRGAQAGFPIILPLFAVDAENTVETAEIELAHARQKAENGALPSQGTNSTAYGNAAPVGAQTRTGKGTAQGSVVSRPYIENGADNFGEAVETEGRTGYNENRGDISGRTTEFRELQAASKGLSEDVAQMFHSGDRVIDEGIRQQLSGVLGGEIQRASGGVRYAVTPLINQKTGGTVNLVNGVDAETFHDVFEIVQKYLRHGDAVDVHNVEDYQDTKNHLSDNGLRGFAVTPGGDLISVFNLGTQGFLKTIKDVVGASGATIFLTDQSECP